MTENLADLKPDAYASDRFAEVYPVLPVDYFEHFRTRALQDAIAQALPHYWERRAQQFKSVGTEESMEMAQACRNAATFWWAQWHGKTPDHVMCVVCETPTSPWSCSCSRTEIQAVS